MKINNHNKLNHVMKRSSQQSEINFEKLMQGGIPNVEASRNISKSWFLDLQFMDTQEFAMFQLLILKNTCRSLAMIGSQDKVEMKRYADVHLQRNCVLEFLLSSALDWNILITFNSIFLH